MFSKKYTWISLLFVLVESFYVNATWGIIKEPIKRATCNCILIGPPCTGKSIQGRLLSQKKGVPYISLRVIVNEHIRKNSDIGKILKPYVESFSIMPDDILEKVINQRLKRKDCSDGFILDSYPKTLKQLKYLLKEIKIDHVLYFKTINTDEIVQRCLNRLTCKQCNASYTDDNKSNVCNLCGGILHKRPDDKIKIIEKRLKEFEEKQVEMIEYLKGMSILREIEAEGSIEDVHKRILQGFSKCFTYEKISLKDEKL